MTTTIDLIQIVLIGFGTGLGSAFGVELAKVVFQKLQGIKIIKKQKTTYYDY